MNRQGSRFKRGVTGRMFALAGLIALRAGSTQAQTSSARSAYTPLFSGVFWSVQDTVLEDIDRIESSTVIF